MNIPSPSPSSSILIYTDGACTGNPGPGGWGSIVALPDGTVHELGGGVPETTNNRMEMAAAIRALAILEPPLSCGIILYTDSKYLIQGITQWVWGWRSHGWKTKDGKDVANRNLWEELVRHVTRLKPATINWKYVRGHIGNPGNERCDAIAVSFKSKKPERLYVGPLDGYFVDINDLPEEQALPEQKKSSGTTGATKYSSGSGAGSGSSGGSAGPVSYLSYHNGVVNRHSTWAECERRVKGQSNAKYKKTKSQQEEIAVLEGWGLDSSIEIE